MMKGETHTRRATPPRIYVDMDDVLCDTAERLLVLLGEAFGKQVPLEDIHSFDLGVSFGLSREELRRFLHLAHRPEALDGYNLRPDAVAGLTHWRECGYEVWIVTGRPTVAYEATCSWLARMEIPHDRLLFVDKYGHHARLGNAEGDLRAAGMDELRELGFCLAVEDSGDMAQHLAREVGVPVALMDRPWNRDVAEISGQLTRCRDWQEVAARFARPHRVIRG